MKCSAISRRVGVPDAGKTSPCRPRPPVGFAAGKPPRRCHMGDQARPLPVEHMVSQVVRHQRRRGPADDAVELMPAQSAPADRWWPDAGSGRAVPPVQRAGGRAQQGRRHRATCSGPSAPAPTRSRAPIVPGRGACGRRAAAPVHPAASAAGPVPCVRTAAPKMSSSSACAWSRRLADAAAAATASVNPAGRCRPAGADAWRRGQRASSQRVRRPRPVRSNSGAPKMSSSSACALVTAGWLMPAAAATRVSEPSGRCRPAGADAWAEPVAQPRAIPIHASP